MSIHSQEAALDIEQEYKTTLRLQSNARFLSKKQWCAEEIEAFLKTEQELITPALWDLTMHPRTSSDIELAMAGYFDASAEASEMCVELLRNIKTAQSNYQSMDSFLASMSEDGTASTSAASAPLALNPFCISRSNFRQIHDKYSSMFRSIRSCHKKVTRKLKIVKAIKKLLKIGLVVACGAAAVAAVAAAAHLLFFGLMVGPAAAGLCPMALRKRTTKTKQSSKAASLLQLREQLDTAAKGTYVLGNDLDTVSQLVARLSDGIERENAMAQWCVETASEGSSVLEMVSELKRSHPSSRRLVEELEEQVCLCLATMHRARLLQERLLLLCKQEQCISYVPYETSLERSNDR
ncbi:hypothetical protein EJB05_38022, partial [Eragrostis curvula]